MLKHAGPRASVRVDVVSRHGDRSPSPSATTVGERSTAPRGQPVTDCSAFGNGWRSSEDEWRPGPTKPAASSYEPSCRTRSRRDLDMVRVVLADDQPLVRAGLRMILAGEEDIEVVGEAADGAEAVDGLRRPEAGRDA